MANTLDDYKKWMPLKDMANVSAAVKATIPSALETPFVIPARPIPTKEQAREELSHLERPAVLPKPEIVATESVAVESTPQKRGWSWVNLTLLGAKPDKRAPQVTQDQKNMNKLKK